MNMKRFCTNCGNELVADTAFCNNCGTPIKDVTVAESTGTSRLLDARVDPDTQPRSGRSGRLLLIAVATTIAIAIAIGGVWWGLGFPQLDKDKAATAKKSSETAEKSDSSGSTSADAKAAEQSAKEAAKRAASERQPERVVRELVEGVPPHGTQENTPSGRASGVAGSGAPSTLASERRSVAGVGNPLSRSPSSRDQEAPRREAPSQNIGPSGVTFVFADMDCIVLGAIKQPQTPPGKARESFKPSEMPTTDVYQVLDEARLYFEKNCLRKTRDYVDIRLYFDRVPDDAHKIYLLGNPTQVPGLAVTAQYNFGIPQMRGWGISHVWVMKQEQAQAQARTEEVARRQAEASQQAAAARKAAEAESKNKMDAFFAKHGVTGFVNMETLWTNPFGFEGQSVVLVVGLDHMVSATRGVMGASSGHPVVISDIPKGTFTSRARFVLVGRVLGSINFEGNIHQRPVPHLKFITANVCKDQSMESCF